MWLDYVKPGKQMYIVSVPNGGFDHSKIFVHRYLAEYRVSEVPTTIAKGTKQKKVTRGA